MAPVTPSSVSKKTPAKTSGGVLKSGKKSEAKRARLVLSIQKKVELVQRLEKGESRATLMEEFGVSSSTIYDLKKQKSKLLGFVGSTEGPTKTNETRKTLKGSALPELDQAVYMWFRAQRSEGKPVSGPLIIEKAKKLRDDLGISKDCTFSVGWLRRFKQRHGIRKLNIHGEKLSADHEAAEAYKDTFLRVIREHEVSIDQVYNADETAIYWRCLPTSTLGDFTEESAPGYKIDKDRVTAMPCANVSGTHKLPMLVVGKFAKPRCFKNIIHFPVIYMASGNAWMTQDLFKEWFFKHFVPSVKEFQRSSGQPEDSKAILILDNCRAHPPATELVSGHILAVYLPPNVTSLIQPMDQGIIQNFKHFYRSALLRKMVTDDAGIEAFQKAYTLRDAIFNIALSWKEVTSKTIRNCWKKLWPLAPGDEIPDFDGFEDDPDDIILQQVETLRKIAAKAPQGHPVHDVDDSGLEEWLQLDAEEPVVEELTDEAIVEALRTPTRVLECEPEEEQEDHGCKVTWSRAKEAFEDLSRFFESNELYTHMDVINLHLMYVDFIKKRASITRQADIRTMLAQAAAKVRPTPSTPERSPPRSIFLFRHFNS